MIDRESIYFLLRKKMEDAGFVFEKEQQPHFQNARDKELKFIHPKLEHKFTKLGLKNQATKFYIKPLSDEEESEIGLTTGKTSPLFHLDIFPVPNEVDTYKNTEVNAWVNKIDDESLDRLLKAIYDYLTPTPEDLEEEFRNKVSESMALDSKKRNSRLEKSPKRPEKITITTVGYKRNPDVVAEVLSRANGQCKKCKEYAPFLRKKDQSPYLEVHHIVQLSKNGEDTVDNAIALCPNCHREQHFG